MPGNGIFINHRRDDKAGLGAKLSDRLAGPFGQDRVFMELDPIGSSDEIATDIGEALTDGEACAVLTGRQRLTIADTSDHHRFDDPTDIVRLDIAAAARQGTRSTLSSSTGPRRQHRRSCATTSGRSPVVSRSSHHRTLELSHAPARTCSGEGAWLADPWVRHG